VSANVGDSTALLLPPPFRGKYEFLTVDHGPESQEEYMRVRNLKKEEYPEKLLFVYDKTNVFRKYECPSVFNEDGTKDQTFVANPWGNGLHPTNVRYEPAVYAVTPRTIAKDSTCIAMTRALGDFYAHQFGLTNVPSLLVKKLPAGLDFTLLVASDGIWDCWKYEDFMQFVNDQFNKGKNITDVGTTVLNESIQRAITNFGSKHYDDACIVIWQMRQAQNSSSNTSSNNSSNLSSTSTSMSGTGSSSSGNSDKKN
jgi:serine/threonine protein phosphatase PrpC